MRNRLNFLLCFLLLSGIYTVSYAQSCPATSLGQNPSTAFPVCGTATYSQASVNLCNNGNIVSPKCANGVLEAKNPYWYKFTCFQSGTLGFTIVPNNASSDYDWQVYDITGRTNLNDVYTVPSLTICSNWSQFPGNTGTTATAANLLECEGTVPQFSRMPQLIAGHEYLLLVSHFTDSQAGYGLQFGGGSAVITDTTKPAMKQVSPSCDGARITVKLNKRIKCASLSANGTDFKLYPSGTIASAAGIGCGSGFDTDSIVLTLATALTPGNYQIQLVRGSDNNTLLDLCDNPTDTGRVAITVLPVNPTPMDSIKPVAAICKPGAVELVFKNPIQCSSIAADGSDFAVTGPSAITIASAGGTCAAGLTTIITVKFNGNIAVGGNYTISLKTGSDGNTLLNECAKPSLPASLPFTVADTVSPRFTYQIFSSCKADTVHFRHPGGHGVNKWKWTFDGNTTSTQQNPIRVYTTIGTKNVSLEVTNGVCVDSFAVTFSLDSTRVHAQFEATSVVCPQDTAFFVNTSFGPVTTWYWDFKNGVTSSDSLPRPQFYPANGATVQTFRPVLVVSAANGCTDTAYQTITVPGNCYIAVATAFTPNGDGLNDFLYPLNAYKADNLVFKVYNRLGQIVFQTTDWTKKWDGTIKGVPQASDTFIWTLTYIFRDTKKPVSMKGNTVLIR